MTYASEPCRGLPVIRAGQDVVFSAAGFHEKMGNTFSRSKLDEQWNTKEFVLSLDTRQITSPLPTTTINLTTD